MPGGPWCWAQGGDKDNLLDATCLDDAKKRAEKWARAKIDSGTLKLMAVNPHALIHVPEHQY